MSDKELAHSGSVASRSFGFFSESFDELKKISTPTRQETIQATVVTLFIMVFVALVLFAMDVVFSTIMSSVISSGV
jgi:preprotein translocase SecE subunit